ncbi:MAG: penicillin-binding protein 2 [Planctomycetota bacterium]|nr:penicillin-binding protein 2 [Planctomycetota bacterium]
MDQQDAATPLPSASTAVLRAASGACHSAAWGPLGGVDRAVKLRQCAVFVPLCLLFAALGVRLYVIQVLEHEAWAAKAKRQRTATERLPAPRGTIKGAGGETLVFCESRKILFADLKILKDAPAAAAQLAPLLEADAESLARRMDRPDRRVVYLARNLEPDLAEKIQALGLRGLGFEEDFRRRYPLGTECAHVLGWSGVDGGKEGVELALDGLLRGIPGFRAYERDAARRALSRGGEHAYTPEAQAPRPGMEVELTLHPGIQHVLEDELDLVTMTYHPKSCIGVVLDVRTGALVALACRPTYDPNRPGAAKDGDRRNRVLTDCFEPGSTFKTFIAAQVLELKLASRGTAFFCQNGAWKVGYRTLHDAHAYGTLSLEQIITKSSNIGAAKLGLLLGIDGVYDAVAHFGFGEKTRIDLTGEGRGIVRPRAKWTKDSLLSVPMGQEIAVTPIQLASAYAAMVNGGMLLRPQVVQRIVNPRGETLFELRTEPVRRVLSERTSLDMREILHETVLTGTARSAWCPEYELGGKTGTAQIPGPGGYSHERYIASFCGFGPVENPRLVCLIAVNEPDKKLGYYGGTVAAPPVKEVLRRGLKALGVPPRPEREQELAEKEFKARRHGG